MSLVQKDYYSTQDALERVRLALPQEDAEQNLIEVLALGKINAWFIDQAGERYDIPTELWEAFLNHRTIDRRYDTLTVDWETGEARSLRVTDRYNPTTSNGHRGLLRFDCTRLDSVIKSRPDGDPDGYAVTPPPKKSRSRPGRRSMMHLVMDEMHRRHANGKLADSLEAESGYLEIWAANHWKNMGDADRPSHPPKLGTISNHLGGSKGPYKMLKTGVAQDAPNANPE